MTFKRVDEPSPLRRARYRRSWPLAKASEVIGVDISSLSRWERGVQSPTALMCLKILLVYPELTLVELVDAE
mgnify:CR=1 FL=1